MSGVVIIGGGPAGCMAGLMLTRAGVNVTLVEQHRFPRAKVCGECLSALGLEVVERAGLVARLRRAGPAVLKRARLVGCDGPAIEIALPAPMWGISRDLLDAELMGAAVDAGVRVRQPWRCEGIATEAGALPRVRARDLITNQVEEIEADYVVVADGKGMLVYGKRKSEAHAARDFGIKARFEEIDGPKDAIELFGLRGCYGGLAPIEAGRWNAAFSVPAEYVREANGNLEKMMAALIDRNPLLAKRLSTGRRIGEWIAAALPRYGISANWPERVIPIGNAAAAIEPIGGEGMGLALASAEIAANAIVEARTGAIDATELRAAFVGMWRGRAVACRAGGILMGWRRGWAIARTAARWDAVTEMAMWGMGKVA